MVMSEDEKRNTAYHESGHALVARLMPKSDPVHKVTIIPRGRALGLTMQLPAEDHYSYDKQYLLSRIAILFGGRIAEEVFMHQMTTGASNDFERATQMARDMVVRYGMSDVMGPMVYGENENEVFLGRSVTQSKHISAEHDGKGRMQKFAALLTNSTQSPVSSSSLIRKKCTRWRTLCSNGKPLTPSRSTTS